MSAPLRVEVTALGELDGALGDLDLGSLTIGVPMIRVEDGVARASGIPELLRVGDLDVPLVPSDTWLAHRGFTAKAGEPLRVETATGPGVVLVGLGGWPETAEAGLDNWRKAVAEFVRCAAPGASTADPGAETVPSPAVMLLPSPDVEGPEHAPWVGCWARVAAEAAGLAAYRFVEYKRAADGGRLERLLLGCGPGSDLGVAASGAAAGEVVAEAVCFARDLVNHPPSVLSPRRMAEMVEARLGDGERVALEVWDEQRIAEERLGGLLGVARGSAEPPRLLLGAYTPAGTGSGRPHVVLVGKGITFDSGGLSLKSPGGMTTMKTDMSGAAAVFSALWACSELGLDVEVTAIAPITENMPGGRATKPGDVLTIRDGQTIEVLNTDAEGRLVLADALCLAVERAPDAIVDVATLTGACVVALGKKIAGVFANDEDLLGRLRSAGEAAGEPSWPLPLPEDYRGHIDSEIADMKNIGKEGQAGAIAAALLLERFVGSVPWAHLDIAGPARSEEDSGLFAKGGTGFAVRTLIELLRSYEGR